MAERYVRMNILSSGADKAKATLDDLAMRARKLEAESPDLKITADDTKAQAKIKDLQLKIQILNRERAEISMETKGDEEVKAKLLDVTAKLRDLDEKVAKPEISIQGMARAEADLIRIKLLMDTIHGKSVDVKVQSDVNSFQRILGRSFGLPAKQGAGKIEGLLGGLSKLLGGGGGGAAASAGSTGAEGATSGILSSLAGASNAYTGGGIAALIALAASLTPALLPFGIGAGTALGGGVLASYAGAHGLTTLKADQLALAQAKAALRGSGNNNATNRLALRVAQGNLTHAQSLYGGFIPFGKGITSLGQSALESLGGALNAREPGGFRMKGGKPGYSAGSPSFIQGLTGIMGQFGGFIHTLEPGLAAMFRASLPFAQAFAKIMEQLAKALMPAFTQSMKALTPYIPQIVQGFGFLSQGIADFIKNLGPGMQASVTIFKAVMMATKGILIGLSYAVDYLAKGFANFGHQVLHAVDQTHEGYDRLRHDTAVAFDYVRHYVANAWDSTWNETVGAAIRSENRISADIANWQHDIAKWFDSIRHYMSASWDATWNDTVGAAERGVRNVIAWFPRLWSGIWDNIRHWPQWLWNEGHAMLDALGRGVESMAGKIFGFFKNIGHGIMSALHSVFNFGSPSKTMYKLGQWIVQGLHKGIESAVGGLGGAMGKVHYILNGGVMQWQGTVRRALAMEGLNPGLASNVLYQMQTESGGNPNAINLWDANAAAGDPSRGLMQTIMSTFMAYHWPGTSYDIYNPMANIAAALNYARHRYGPYLMSGGMGIGSGHGYAAGGWITEPIVGMGLRSGGSYSFGEVGPEYVSPAGSMGGGGATHYHINVSPTPMAHPADIGREVVYAIRKFEQRSGTSWRA